MKPERGTFDSILKDERKTLEDGGVVQDRQIDAPSQPLCSYEKKHCPVISDDHYLCMLRIHHGVLTRNSKAVCKSQGEPPAVRMDTPRKHVQADLTFLILRTLEALSDHLYFNYSLGKGRVLRACYRRSNNSPEQTSG